LAFLLQPNGLSKKAKWPKQESQMAKARKPNGLSKKAKWPKQDKLHSGMYVNVQIKMQQAEAYLALPTESVLRSPDGDYLNTNTDSSGSFI
jgi:hypothetical protein